MFSTVHVNKEYNTEENFAAKPSDFIKNQFLRSAQYCAKTDQFAVLVCFWTFDKNWSSFRRLATLGTRVFFLARVGMFRGKKKNQPASKGVGEGLGGRGKVRGTGERRFSRAFFSRSTSPSLSAPITQARKNCWANQVTQSPTPLNGLLLSCLLQVS